MIEKPLISVIFPVYNAEKYLKASIESILNQSYKNFEFIIVNDGSIDRSLEIIKQYAQQDKRIKVISRKNKGLINSLNEAISKAKGEYIARMDADDVSLKYRFEKQLEYMKKNDIDICGCHYFVINEEDKYLNTKIVPISEHAINLNIAYSVPFAHGSVMIKKELFQKHHYDLNFFSLVEDYALWLKMYNNHVKFGNVDEFLFMYREFPNSFSKTKIKEMERERAILSKQFIKNHKIKLQKSIDNQLKKQLSNWEEIYLTRVSFLLQYKIIENYYKVNKQVFIFSLLSFLKQKIFSKI